MTDGQANPMALRVRKADAADALAIAEIHGETFPRQMESTIWVSATLAAEPRFFVFLAEIDAVPVGYIFWAQKSGIRPAAVLELDQVAVLAAFRRRGVAEQLIRESLTVVKTELAARGQALKSLIVSTRADNGAQRIYTKTLGAAVAATIDNLYSAQEVFMVAECGKH